MARYENPPFPLGTTFFGGDSTLIDAAVGVHMEGLEWEFPDDDATFQQGVAPAVTHTIRRMRVLRNSSGVTLSAKLVAALNASATTPAGYVGQTSGYLTDGTGKGYPIDEAVGTVAANDLFWVCVRGRAKVTTAAAGDTNISIGKYVVASTGGKVIEQSTEVFPNCVGRILESVNAINTDVNIWVDF